MKHHLSHLLVTAVLGLGGPLVIVCDSHAAPAPLSIADIGPALEKAMHCYHLRKADHERLLALKHVDQIAIAPEAVVNGYEYTYPAASPSPAQIERSSYQVPGLNESNGSLRRAWLAAVRTPERVVFNNCLGLIWRGPRSYDRLA